MEFKTKPYYEINRWWEKIIANAEWIINTDNEEAIQALTHIFWKVVKTVKKTETKKD